MNKILVFLLLCLCGVTLHAQPWMPINNHKPVKLADVVRQYRLTHPEVNKAEAEEEQGHEDEEYFFQRWVWYWQQHLDEQGYMVAPQKTLDEWNKYLREATTNVQHKGTGSPANWSFVGPDSTAGGYWGIGRINVIKLHPTDTNTIFVGTAGGGTWRTTNGGRTWAPLYSNFPTVGVSDIVINPRNPNTIYVCTGDADAWGNYSMGVIKSMDGGTNWASTGLLWTPSDYIWARSLVMDPIDTNKLVLAARDGIHITRNGGVSWTNVKTGDFKQVLYKPRDPSTIYASRYSVYPDSSAQIMRSVDSGATWTVVTAFTDVERINFAVCDSSPAIVKAIASSKKESGLQGIYGSVNSGASFTPLLLNDTSCSQNLLGYQVTRPTTQCNGQGWYDLCIAINPRDANKVIIGGVNNYYSTDGGRNWKIVTTWYSVPSVQTVHADKHWLIYDARVAKIYEGCDGGIYGTPDSATGVWQNMTNGMGISQFYRNACANGVNWCIGGAQDNGTLMVNNPAYLTLTGGDGMQCQIDYDAPATTWYTSSQNGSINKTINGGSSYSSISNTIPDTLKGIWITPYIIHPTTNTTLLVGIDKLFSSIDQGGSWVPISPRFDSNSKINHIAMSPADVNYIYLTLENSNIYFSPDYGVTWDTISTAGFTSSISRIKVDPKNAEILWVTFSGYGTRKVAFYNRLTRSWTNRNTGLPNVPVNCIVIDSFSGTKYVGTDIAVYYLDTTMTTWAIYNTNLPSVNIEDLNINYTTHELWAATYGRGMWRTNKREYPTGIPTMPVLTDVITITPNPSKGVFTINTSNPGFPGQKVTIRIVSAIGTTAWREEQVIDASGKLRLEPRGLVPGVYTCEIANDRILGRSRVVVY